LLALGIVGVPSMALAERVLLYEEDGGNGVRLTGSVTWRTARAWAGEEWPAERVIHADIQVPERGLALTWTFQRNHDPTLPASHILEIVNRSSYWSGGVVGLLVKQSEQSRAVLIAGRSIMGAAGSMLIGLSNVEVDRQRNLYLMKAGAWFDLALVYENGRRAILAIEKGTQGTAFFDAAFAEWGYRELQPPPNVWAAPPKAQPQPAPPKGRPQVSVGSGFFLTTTGHVLTNSHVVQGCAKVSLRGSGGMVQSAQVLARAEADDLAILKADGKVAATATLRTSPSPRSGEAIVVFGFPLSGLLASTGNVTIGNVTALAGLRDDSRQLQISAPVQPGNSGGPVLDMSGNVIGVVVSKLDALRVAKLSDDIPQNINFAIKASTAVNFLDARGITYSTGQPGKELSIPDVAEHARSISVEVRCER
jgi:S1-C subfamily serine protease